VLDRLSSWIRASIVLFFGVAGLPIPFRQKLLYVIGNPIYPHGPPVEENVNRMHEQFCAELHRIFDRYKESYGWGHKSLHVLSR
jgi:Diacylglycerol acyltransferase